MQTITIRKTDESEITRLPQLEPLEGYLWRREGARLAYLAERVPNGQVIVELGSNRGKSSCFLATGSKAGNRVRVFCHDLWDLGGQGEAQHLGFDDPNILRIFDRQITEARVRSLVVQRKGDSVASGRSWNGASIGLLFIDGDHRQEAARADFDAWIPHIAPNAWVCFHDYSNPRHKTDFQQFPGVFYCVHEILNSEEYKGRVQDVTLTGRILAVKFKIPE